MNRLRRSAITLLATLAIAFAGASPAVAASPAFTVTTSGDVALPAQTAFAHTYTVTNTGDAAGQAGVWETTSSYLVILSVQSPQCSIYYAFLHGGAKVQGGTYCNLGIIQPGASVTVTEMFKTKTFSVSPTIAVNHRSPIDGRWLVTIQ